MQLFGIRTRLIEPKDDLVSIILEALSRQGLMIDDGDVLVVASKVVSMAQGRLTRLDTISLIGGRGSLWRGSWGTAYLERRRFDTQCRRRSQECSGGICCAVAGEPS